jgi:integrase/recombinase XerD
VTHGDQVLLFTPQQDRLAEYQRWATHSRLLGDKTVHDRTVILRCALRAESRWFPEGLESASPKQVQRYVESLRPTAATRNAARLALLSFFTYLMDAEHREDNPAEVLPTWKPNECTPRPLEPDQAALFLAAARSHSVKADCLVSGYLLGGFRLSEWANRSWPDLAFDQAYFLAKGRRRQVRYMNDQLRCSVERWREERESKVLVFPSAAGSSRPLSRKQVYGLVQRLGDSVGIDGCHPHQLRHTFAQKLYDDTGDIHLVQVALGHTNIQNTLKYARRSQRGVQEALGNLSY